MISISYEQFKLPNGLNVILHEDHSLPIAAVNVWYHVGSKDEEKGRTGFAHLFEHVMFEGSKHHNKSFFDPLQKVGATLNGSTTTDRTNYWETVPPNYLELALWLESDRMGFLLDALDQKRFDIQRDVVKNERRQSYENRPYGMAYLTLQSAVFPAPHPYNWPTIGSQEDLDAATLEDVKSFFRRFYAPSNASLAIAGDFDPDYARRLVERYFGDIPPGPPINRVGRMDSDLKGRVSLTMVDNVQLPRLYIVWPSGPAFDRDQAPLDVLASALADGKSSRLYRTLIYEKQIAHDVRVFHYAQQIAGEFFIQVTANPGHDLDELEEVVWDELERIRRDSVSEKELARARNQVESQHVRQLERIGGFGGRADQLNYYHTFAADPGKINTDIERYKAVSADDVQWVASALGESFVRLSVLPQRSLSHASAAIDRSEMPKATATPRFNPPVPRRLSLSNGLSILHVEKPGIPLAAFGLMVKAGGVTDAPDKPGLAHLTAHMLAEGTASRTSQQIAEEMEFLGAHLMCEAAREYVLLATETLASHWGEALDIMADVARNATFPAHELERVRKEHLTDLRRIADDPVNIAGRASRGLLYGAETRYGHPLNGTESYVERVARDELSSHFARYYDPRNATLIVVGALSEDEVLSKAEACFGGWTPRNGRFAAEESGHESAPLEPTTLFLADKPGAAQSVIRAGHLTIPRHHPDYYALNLANYILGGNFSARLNMNLRQAKGYSYGYISSIDWALGPSALIAGGGVQTAVTKEAVIETLKEFADIRGQRPITQDEFNNARDGILRGLPSQFETQGQLVQQLTRLVLFDLPDDYFSHYVENLMAISLDDLHRVSSERIDTDHLKVLVVGDRKVIEPGLRELGLPIASVDYEGRRLT
jgi:zinc protease